MELDFFELDRLEEDPLLFAGLLALLEPDERLLVTRFPELLPDEAELDRFCEELLRFERTLGVDAFCDETREDLTDGLDRFCDDRFDEGTDCVERFSDALFEDPTD